MALKDWKKAEIGSDDGWSSNKWIKRNLERTLVIRVRKQYYTENTFYWDVYLNFKLIGYKLKSKADAIKVAKQYMRTH